MKVKHQCKEIAPVSIQAGRHPRRWMLDRDESMFASRTEIGGKSCMFIWCNAAVVVLFENAAQHLWALDQANPIWEFLFCLSSFFWFYHLLAFYCWSHPTDVIPNLMGTSPSLLTWLCCRWCTLNRMSLTSRRVLPIIIVSGKRIVSFTSDSSLSARVKTEGVAFLSRPFRQAIACTSFHLQCKAVFQSLPFIITFSPPCSSCFYVLCLLWSVFSDSHALFLIEVKLSHEALFSPHC